MEAAQTANIISSIALGISAVTVYISIDHWWKTRFKVVAVEHKNTDRLGIEVELINRDELPTTVNSVELYCKGDSILITHTEPFVVDAKSSKSVKPFEKSTIWDWLLGVENVTTSMLKAIETSTTSTLEQDIGKPKSISGFIGMKLINAELLLRVLM